MIRTIIGFLMIFGAVGGLDNNESVLLCTSLAVAGLTLMYFGTKKLNANIS